MNVIDFIKLNVINKLKSDGFNAAIAIQGAQVAANHYNTTAQFSGKGKAFDDCYKEAKNWAARNSTHSDKVKIKK